METQELPRRKRRKKRSVIGGIIKILFLTAVIVFCFCLDHFFHMEQTEGFSSDSLSAGISALPAPESFADEEDWMLILVNQSHPLPEGYEIHTVSLSNGEQIDERIYPALQDMFDAMREDGVYPVVASGYRTTQDQQQILDDKIEEWKAQGLSYEEAKSSAEEWVALPGYSEHELGLAADINADGIHSAGGDVYDWLAENAYRYGFIQRYPEDKTEITGIAYEPWHYRYVGEKAAAEIKEQGICLEEYLEERGK